MKALPKRKGNIYERIDNQILVSLNESPSEKEGKLGVLTRPRTAEVRASMKALPKRKGNGAGKRRSRVRYRGPQ